MFVSAEAAQRSIAAQNTPRLIFSVISYANKESRQKVSGALWIKENRLTKAWRLSVCDGYFEVTLWVISKEAHKVCTNSLRVCADRSFAFAHAIAFPSVAWRVSAVSSERFSPVWRLPPRRLIRSEVVGSSLPP